MKFFAKGLSEQKIIVDLWQGNFLDIIAKLDYLALHPEQKRIVYAAFSKKYPKKREKLLKRMTKLNFIKSFPYYFLQNLK